MIPINPADSVARQAKKSEKQMLARQVTANDRMEESLSQAFNPLAAEREQGRLDRFKTLDQRKKQNQVKRKKSRASPKKLKKTSQRITKDATMSFPLIDSLHCYAISEKTPLQKRSFAKSSKSLKMSLWLMKPSSIFQDRLKGAYKRRYFEQNNCFFKSTSSGLEPAETLMLRLKNSIKRGSEKTLANYGNSIAISRRILKNITLFSLS